MGRNQHSPSNEARLKDDIIKMTTYRQLGTLHMSVEMANLTNFKILKFSLKHFVKLFFLSYEVGLVLYAYVFYSLNYEPTLG